MGETPIGLLTTNVESNRRPKSGSFDFGDDDTDADADANDDDTDVADDDADVSSDRNVIRS